MVGQRIDGKYELIKVLGQGAMGVVYRARHAATGREVALKLVQPDRIGAPGTAAASAALQRFQREARAMGAVADSPHVVQVLDAGADRESGAAFMVMELLNGEDVETLAGRLGPLPVDLALRIVAQALTGLVPAHEAGIVHRDIKPSNLFLAKRADGERIVKVLDFGIVKLLDPASGPGGQTTDAPSKLTRTGGTLGSPAYMSPEQVQASKQLDTRTDLWSMGAVLYQLLCGALPFQEVTELPQLLLAIYFRDPPRVAQRATWVPPDVDAIVHRALQRDLAARYATAREMREAIARVLGGATAITEGMLVPSPPETRSAQPASALAMAVSMPAPQGGGTTRISGLSPPVGLAASAMRASSAMGMSPMSAGSMTAGAAGAPDTTPLSVLPASGLSSGAAPSLVAPSGVLAGAMRSPPSAAVPAETARSSDPRTPSGAAPGAATLVSAGVTARPRIARVLVVSSVGLIVAGVLGAAAFAMITRSEAPESGASGTELLPDAGPRDEIDAGADAAPSSSVTIEVKPAIDAGADAGTATPDAPPGPSPAAPSKPAPAATADAGAGPAPSPPGHVPFPGKKIPAPAPSGQVTAPPVLKPARPTID